MSLPAKIVIGLSSYAFRRFLDRYGEEIIAYASTQGEEFVRVYGPKAVRWTAETGRNAYARVAPRASLIVSRVAARGGLSSKGVVIPGAEESEPNRLSTMLFGAYAGNLQQVGAAVRAAAQAGAAQLGNLSDEQIGAAAVTLWRMQNRDGLLGRRLRKTFWERSDSGG